VNEKRPEQLFGGPCDGLDLDLYPTDMTVFPGPHHLRGCGVSKLSAEPEPMYVRCADGVLRYHLDAKAWETSERGLKW